MKKVLILPYFGTFNNYFSLWLESVRNNSSIDFLIVTDVNWKFDIPPNVRIYKMEFSQLKEDFEEKFGFSINLSHPYKLCDFKPYYGFLFEELISDYDFWGYCDCDLVFGDINKFLDDSVFEANDKIMRRGHLSFIRNTYEINRNFFKYNTYKMVINSPCIYGLDESVFGFRYGFAGELIEQGYQFYEDHNCVGDIDFRFFPFHSLSDPEKTCVFHYHNGSVDMITKNENGYLRIEMMYVHLQKRKMKIEDGLDRNNYLIAPNRFISYDEKLLYSDSFWKEVKTEKDDYFDIKGEKISSIKRDILRFLYEPSKLRSIKYRMTGKK